MLNVQQMRDLRLAVDRLGDVSPLLPAELPDVVRRAQAGDEVAKSRFVLSYARLVAKGISRSRVPPHIEIDDLVQVGLMAICRALPRLAPDRPPGPYLSLAATRAVHAAICGQAALFTPRVTQPRTVSLNAPRGGRQPSTARLPPLTWDELLPDQDAPHPLAGPAMEDAKAEIERALSFLDARQEWSIRARFGLLPLAETPIAWRCVATTPMGRVLSQLERSVAQRMKRHSSTNKRAANPTKSSKKPGQQTGAPASTAGGLFGANAHKIG